MTAAIEVKDLHKTYRTPLRRRKVEAVRGISFSVERGEVFGFLGPNGAGKTTTIRILMGLIRSTRGSAKILGKDVPSRAARARLGFLPEAPYFYDYLTAGEMLDLTGRLFGLDRAERRKRASELVEMVGLGYARNTPLKKYSKGMLQRAGIGQALINDPELVVFDEPMGGLDPVGRKEVRDIIFRLREQGKTVFFSSHILADVEMVADRVAIVVRGKVHDIGELSQLVGDKRLGTDVSLRVGEDVSDAGVERLVDASTVISKREGELVLHLGPDDDVDDFLVVVREVGARVVSVTPRHETLEDLFIRVAKGDEEAT
jgi:ABC-2 type transport system ATP-binding protein